MNVGFTELLVVLGIALLFFGPSRLPALGKSIGEAIRGFKSGINEKDTEREVTELESKPKKDDLDLSTTKEQDPVQKT